ncbi:DNA topoisomerase 1 [Acipenser ruthenus]|uniref:DNA topoisomerase I n=1 Tax=Acipenser ruthenus TaxID=7906 RepID=A0A444TZB2_ACIRT|nr:DNA topoisomerase 1 [Acipenser ruthenus]
MRPEENRNEERKIKKNKSEGKKPSAEELGSRADTSKSKNKKQKETGKKKKEKSAKEQEEPEYPDFHSDRKNRVKKRAREEDPQEETLVARRKKKVKTETEERAEKTKKDVKVKKEKKVKEEPQIAAGGKRKKTKEEIEAARALKIKKKEEEEQQRWRWWEEEKYEDGIKWKFLEHKGAYFPPEYEPFPDHVKFYYDGKPMALSLAAEEVAGFFAHMLDHEYTTKEVFRNNFFTDWRKEMTLKERMIITDLEKCNFNEMFEFYKNKMEAKRNMSKEEKQKIKEANQKIVEVFGFCLMDQHQERIGNFKIEPPGLFRGRGDHPKQGKLKKRIQPEDVIINCSRDSKIPEPPLGHKWKEVRFDNTVTWLASWTENVQGSCKYIMLNANSKLKGEKDWEKYEVARNLKSRIAAIREKYKQDWKSKQMVARQRAVALYFIDKLALRAGTEKEEGETADTVGCCSLRVEHIKLYPELDGQQHVVEFDFLGKDSIRYYNKVPVKKSVFKNLKLFMENKQGDDDLFDRLNTSLLNKHLNSLMPGLTAKVFRTFNASVTLQQQLKELTDSSANMPEKILSYNRANRAVAVLCNHQRAPPKTFEQSMANLQSKASQKSQANYDNRKQCHRICINKM